MKLYHVISLSTAGLLSIGALGLLSHTSKGELNQDFKIETISGDASVLNGIEFENIIKMDQNKYAKLVLNGEDTTIIPTIYDAYQRITEEQLKDRELYRHVYHPTTLETEDYLITVQFDYRFPYSSDVPTTRLAVKNKETGEITVKNPVVDEFSSSEWSQFEFLTEYNGAYYYVLTTYERNNYTARTLVYTVNPDTLELTFKFEKPFNDIASPTYNDNLLYLIEPSQDSDQPESQLWTVNLETGDTTTQSLGKALYPESIMAVSDQVYIFADSKLYYHTPTEDTVLTEIPSANFSEMLKSSDYYWMNQQLVEGDYLYLTFDTSQQGAPQQLLAVVDTKTQQLVYEGKINIRQDQGLIESYKLK